MKKLDHNRYMHVYVYNEIEKIILIMIRCIHTNKHAYIQIWHTYVRAFINARLCAYANIQIIWHTNLQKTLQTHIQKSVHKRKDTFWIDATGNTEKRLNSNRLLRPIARMLGMPKLASLNAWQEGDVNAQSEKNAQNKNKSNWNGIRAFKTICNYRWKKTNIKKSWSANTWN